MSLETLSATGPQTESSAANPNYQHQKARLRLNSKIKQKEISAEQIPAQVRREHLQLWRSLQTEYPELAQKYTQARADLEELAAYYNLPLNYNVLLNQTRQVDLGQHYLEVSGDDNYVSVHPQLLTQAPNKVLAVMVHEVLGHGGFERYQVKQGERVSVLSRGLQTDKQTDIARSFDTAQQQEFARTVKGLPREQQTTVSRFYYQMKQQTPLDSETAAAAGYLQTQLGLASHTELYQLMQENLTKPETKVLGRELNEAVTEFLSVLLASKNDYVQRNLLSEMSGYRDTVRSLTILNRHLEENFELVKVALGQGEVNEFEFKLMTAKFEGSPGEIIKYLHDKTGVKLRPPELYALDFSRIYEAG